MKLVQASHETRPHLFRYTAGHENETLQPFANVCKCLQVCNLTMSDLSQLRPCAGPGRAHMASGTAPNFAGESRAHPGHILAQGS